MLFPRIFLRSWLTKLGISFSGTVLRNSLFFSTIICRNACFFHNRLTNSRFFFPIFDKISKFFCAIVWWNIHFFCLIIWLNSGFCFPEQLDEILYSFLRSFVEIRVFFLEPTEKFPLFARSVDKIIYFFAIVWLISWFCFALPLDEMYVLLTQPIGKFTF